MCKNQLRVEVHLVMKVGLKTVHKDKSMVVKCLLSFAKECAIWTCSFMCVGYFLQKL